ncbi:penicillin-binding protein activator [Aliidiomarina shirensis]|uniref:penicillin-binding protein activator n=1 Tax=Aliidiomarina shirensis TaxID=1048642 RepID=UPI001300B743|nr:penicillin-binding protein activator [Aliidiomarina shirensis]
MPNKLARCIFVFAVSVIALAGCSSAPEPRTERDPVPDSRAPDVETTTADTLLAEARAAAPGYQQQELLLSAATQYLDEGKTQKAGVLLSTINAQQIRPDAANRLQLQKARFAAALENWQRVLELTDDLERQLNQRAARTQLYTLRYQAFEHSENWLDAAQQLILRTRYTDDIDNQAIWQILTRVPAEYWRESRYQSDELTRGWFSLLEQLTQALDYNRPIASALEAWQRTYPEHPAQNIVEDMLTTEIFTHRPQRIAVLLPLTGPLADHGMAVRNGVLGALSADRPEIVSFYDTAALSPEDIQQQLLTSDVDFVIGPLDRAAIEAFVPYAQGPWNQLWLNQQPSDMPMQSEHAFFALDSESEAESAVRWLDSKGHKNIILLGPDTQRGRGTSARLQNWWQIQHGEQSIRSGFYSSSGDMAEAVQQALNVNSSQQRIDRLESVLVRDQSLRSARGEAAELEYEVRSRQDIDAIYLLGDANQVRLLKPYIDVNLSAFGKRIPVYASSAVHQEQRSLGENDLDSVYFSDAPWTLRDSLEPDLKQQLSNAMLPWTLNRQRLVAMGFDAFEMVPKFSIMLRFPGYQYPGLTGQLRISEQIVERELDWARFDGHEIKLEVQGYVNSRGRN